MPSERRDYYGNVENIYTPDEQRGYWEKYEREHGQIVPQTDLERPFNDRAGQKTPLPSSYPPSPRRAPGRPGSLPN